MSVTTLKATAQRLIQKWGRTVTVTRTYPATPAANPWEGVTLVATTMTLKGVWLDPRNAEQNFDFAQKLIPKSDIAKEDWHVLVAALDCTFPPEPGHTVTDSSGTYKVVTVSPAAPGDHIFLYILQVQR